MGDLSNDEQPRQRAAQPLQERARDRPEKLGRYAASVVCRRATALRLGGWSVHVCRVVSRAFRLALRNN